MIQVYPNNTYFRGHNNVNQVTPDGPIKITAATSITQSGKLWNITTIFDNDTIDLDNNDMIYRSDYSNVPYSTEMKVKPIKGLMPGDYTLTIGAGYGSVSYSKIIDLVVTK
jgi:hypothetical protein